MRIRLRHIAVAVVSNGERDRLGRRIRRRAGFSFRQPFVRQALEESEVFSETPKTAGETPALPGTSTTRGRVTMQARCPQRATLLFGCSSAGAGLRPLSVERPGESAGGVEPDHADLQSQTGAQPGKL